MAELPLIRRFAPCLLSSLFTVHVQLGVSSKQTQSEALRIVPASSAHARCRLCVLSHNFRPSFLKLSFLKRLYPSLPLMLLTATATRHVQTDVLKILGLQRESVDFIRQSFNRRNVAYSVQMKECIQTIEGETMTIWTHMKRFIEKWCTAGSSGSDNKGAATSTPASTAITGARPTPATATAAIFSSAASSSTAAHVAAASSSVATPAAPSTPGAALTGSGIIYAGTRALCHDIAAELKKLGVTASAYHAGLPPKERAETQAAWMANKIRVIVATNAFGMGQHTHNEQAQTAKNNRT